MALSSSTKLEIIKGNGKNEKDTGSSEVQIALLTKRISDLTEHLKIAKKDHASRIGLLKLVSSRKRLLKYLKKTNISSFHTLIKKLNIRSK